jgi:hypothetical protein
MKIIKITAEMAKQFREKRSTSQFPEFKISNCGEITHGCKVIEEAEKAVFVHCSGFLWCGGFWVSKEVYNTLKDGYLVGQSYVKDDRGFKILTGQKINLNDTVYSY